MLPKVVSTAAVDKTFELLEFDASRAAAEKLPIHVLIGDLDPVLIYLK